MSRKKQLIKSFMGVGAMKLLSIPLGLAISIILARVLGPEGFGQYAFIMALVSLVALPVSGGLPQLLTREVASFVHADQWSLYKGALRAAHGWVLMVSVTILAFYGLFGIGAGMLPTEGKWALLPIAIFMIPFLGFGAARVGTIKGLGMPAFAELPQQLIQPVFMFLFFASAAWFQVLDTKIAILGQLIGAALIFFIASWMFYRIQPQGSSNAKPIYQIRRWGTALLPFTLLALVSVLNAQIGIIILGLLGTDEQVAAMRVAERGGQFVVLSLTLVNLVIAPYIVRAHRDGDKVFLQSLAKKSARGAFLLAFPIVMVLIFGGEFLIGLAFGEEYADLAYFPVIIIAIGQLFNVFFGSVGYLLLMSGYERDTLKGQLIAVLINSILCFALVPFYGAIGAAIAVSVAILVWNVLLASLVKLRLGIRSTAF